MELSLADPIVAGNIIWFIGVITWEVIRYRPNRRSRKNKISRTVRSPVEIFSLIASLTGFAVVPLFWIFSGELPAYDHPASWVLILFGAILFTWTISSWTGFWVVPLIWIFSGELATYDHPTSWILILIGAILIAWSMVLFRVTHKALGAMWSFSLDLREGHKLVTSGIYEKVRHPMYSAFWLWAVAQPFLLSNWIAGFSGIIGFGTLYFLRVGQEEKMMEEEFGDQYRDYCQRTKRIIPGIY